MRHNQDYSSAAHRTSNKERGLDPEILFQLKHRRTITEPASQLTPRRDGRQARLPRPRILSRRKEVSLTPFACAWFARVFCRNRRDRDVACRAGFAVVVRRRRAARRSLRPAQRKLRRDMLGKRRGRDPRACQQQHKRPAKMAAIPHTSTLSESTIEEQPTMGGPDRR